jgi:RNA ligase (TIGR02306 family)
MRSLATIQIISDIKPIAGADSIELVLIKGWQCVAKKGEFTRGDLCIYFEVDSFLPIDERYEFLRRTSYRNNEYMGEGFRIKTMSMRGELSQGLALPLRDFPEIAATTDAGANAGVSDLTEILGVRKWELPEVLGNMGFEIGEKPYGIPTTDETRLQSMPEFLDAFKGLPYYITTKMDGTSCTIYCVDGKVGVCGRNLEYKEDPSTSAMWAWVYEQGLKERLISQGENIAIQGEFCGAGIQKNRLKLMKPTLYVFDIVVLREGGGGHFKKLDLQDLQEYCTRLRLDMVPLEETGDSFNYSLDEMLEKARGKYASGMDKEGIVVRTQQSGHNSDINHKMSFKVINNDFLKKEKE